MAGILIIAAIAAYAQEQFNVTPLAELKNSYTNERCYDEVCWLTTHNAYANKNDGWFYAQQALDFGRQFDYGVYSFMIDLHWYMPPGSTEPYIALCHEDSSLKETVALLLSQQNCIFSRMALFGNMPQPATYFFDQVYDWLKNDPNVIITVHLESYLGPDSCDALQKVFESSNIQRFIYKPSSGGKWPTLGYLRKKDERLIIFSDNVGDGCIYTQAYRETKFDLGSYPRGEMRMDRRGKNSPLFVMNHFYTLSYDMPAVGTSFDEINSFDSILERINECYKTQKCLPNFIAVDFVEEGADGGARRAVLRLNQLPPQNFHRFVKTIARTAEARTQDKQHAHTELQ